jgi:hypothetical protein
MKRQVVLILLTLCLAAFTLSAQAKKPLGNDDLIQMVKGGFDEDTVIKAIEANGSSIDTSMQGLLALKNAGVSQKIISAALSGTGGKTAPAPVAAETKEPTDEVGVYVLYKDKLIFMEPEIVTTRTAGTFVSAMTSGIASAKVKGSIKNPQSPLQVSGDLEFTIRCLEGTSAQEYQLLLLESKKDHREFEALRVNIGGAKSGADKNAIELKFDRVAPRTYKVKLTNLKPGEYGFLAPGAVGSANTASSGKIFTFGVIE